MARETERLDALMDTSEDDFEKVEAPSPPHSPARSVASTSTEVSSEVGSNKSTSVASTSQQAWAQLLQPGVDDATPSVQALEIFHEPAEGPRSAATESNAPALLPPTPPQLETKAEEGQIVHPVKYCAPYSIAELLRVRSVREVEQEAAEGIEAGQDVNGSAPDPEAPQDVPQPAIVLEAASISSIEALCEVLRNVGGKALVALDLGGRRLGLDGSYRCVDNLVRPTHGRFELDVSGLDIQNGTLELAADMRLCVTAGVTTFDNVNVEGCPPSGKLFGSLIGVRGKAGTEVAEVAHLKVCNCLVKGCQLFVWSGGELEMDDVSIFESGASPAAIVVTDAQSSLVARRSCVTTHSAGIQLQNGAVADIQTCTLTGNGAGLIADGAGTRASIKESDFSSNLEAGWKLNNGAYVDAANCTVNDCTNGCGAHLLGASRLDATACEFGGHTGNAVKVDGGSEASLRDCTLRGANHDLALMRGGGGLEVGGQYSHVVAENCKFLDNYNAGVWVHSLASVLIRNSQFRHCHACNGVTARYAGTRVWLEQCQFMDIAENGVLACDGAFVKVEKSVFNSCEASLVAQGAGSVCEADLCLLDGGEPKAMGGGELRIADCVGTGV